MTVATYADWIALLDANDEEIARAPARVRRREGDRRAEILDYTAVIIVSEPILGRVAVRSRLTTPLFAVTKDIGKVACGPKVGDTVTIIQNVVIEREDSEEPPRPYTSRLPWWRRGWLR